MTDTQRTETDLLTNLFQDGQTGGIGEQDMRDLIVSLAPSRGSFYLSVAAATTITVANTFVKAAGTTVTRALKDLDDDGGTSNRLRYTGTPTRSFLILGSFSASFAAGTNQNMGLQLYHYDASAASGSLIGGSQINRFVAATDIAAMSVNAMVDLDTNDYIELHVANKTGTNNLQIDAGSLSMIGMID